MAGRLVAVPVLVLLATGLAPAGSAFDYDDARGLLGDPRDGWYDSDPPRVQAAVTDVGYGESASVACFLRSDQTVACRREADPFDADFDVERIPDDARGAVVEVSAGDSSVCYRDVAGNVSCHNAETDEPALHYTGGDAVQATANGRCVLKSNGTVQCLGLEAYGYLDFGVGLTQIDAGAGPWVCGVTALGDVDCWFFGIGCNIHGCFSRNQTRHLAFGDATQVEFAAEHACVLRSPGNVECVDVGPYDHTPPPTPYSGGDAVSLHGWKGGLCYATTAGALACEGTRGPDPGCADFCEDRPLPEDPRGGGAVAVEMSSTDSCWTYADGTITCESDPQPVANLPDDLGLGLDDADVPVTPWIPSQACVSDTDGLAQRDVDRDGVPALYAWRGIAVIPSPVEGDDPLIASLVGLRSPEEAAGWCWIAGDPDDDGTQRSPAASVAPAAGRSLCAPDADGSASKDFDHDGVPALYAWKGNRAGFDGDGTVGFGAQPGWCWVAGDPDDDGVDRAAA